MTYDFPHVVYYAESFCGLSETYVYRTALCLSSITNTTVLTHERKCLQIFPDADLNIREKPRDQSVLSRSVLMARSWLSSGVRDSRAAPPEWFRSLAHSKEGIIYAQFGLAGVRALGAATRLNWPLIVNFHGCDVTTWLAYKGYMRNLERLYRSPRVSFLTPSRYIAEKVFDLGAPTNRTYLYYNPVPIPEKIASNPRESAEIVFLHAGRLMPVKGITYTLRAFARIASDLDCHLRVVGGGPEAGMAAQLTHELGLRNRVTFLGPADPQTVQREMSQADVFVQHSLVARNGETEGLPVAICEAMGQRLPVVSTFHAGIPEVVENGVTGMLVKEKDVEGMADAMRILALEPQLRYRFGQAGRALIENKFSNEAAVQNLRVILKSVSQR